MPPKLTIAIPTYNRLRQLRNRLDELLPQITREVQILIVDNASDEEIGETIKREYSTGDIPILYHRNRVNIGLAANICRCFEISDGEWVWTLGDDDPVAPDAVGSILEILSKIGDDQLLAGINFSTSIVTYQQISEIRTTGDFWALLEDPMKFSNALFLSSCVFRGNLFRSELRLAHVQIYSAAPHIAVPLNLVRHGFKMAVAPPKLVDCNVPDANESWSKIAVFSSIPALAEIPGIDVTSRSLSATLATFAPGLRVQDAIKLIFLDESRDSMFWYIYYSRLLPCLSGRLALRIALIRMIAETCHRVPFTKKAGARILRRFKTKTAESLGNIDRL